MNGSSPRCYGYSNIVYTGRGEKNNALSSVYLIPKSQTSTRLVKIYFII
jgi:hypothetical protein